MSHLFKPGFHLRASNEMILARFINSLGFSVVAIASSLYLRNIGLSDSQVGIIAGLASACIILSSPLIPILLEKFRPMNLYITSALLCSIIYTFMGSTTAAIVAIPLFFLSRVNISVWTNSSAIAFKSTTHTKREFTKAQGMASSLINLGWIIGPLIAGLSLATWGPNETFYVGSAIMILGTSTLLLYPINIPMKRRQKLDSSWIENVRFYLSNKALLKAYLFRTCVSIWWAFIFTFLPLLMVNEGYSLQQVGLATSVISVPLFLLEFKTVDLVKSWGYQRIFLGSYLLMTATMLLGVLSSSLMIFIIGLVIASLALAFLEPICELYLFDQVTPLEEEKAYAIYSTSDSIGGIVGRLGVGLLIGLLSIEFGYIFIGLFTSVAAFTALTLKGE
ncbi:MAG: MFS transporter [Patescibacteria group bacterium]